MGGLAGRNVDLMGIYQQTCGTTRIWPNMGVAKIEDVADVTSKTTDIGSNQQPGRLNNKNGDLSKQHGDLTNQVWDFRNKKWALTINLRGLAKRNVDYPTLLRILTKVWNCNEYWGWQGCKPTIYNCVYILYIYNTHICIFSEFPVPSIFGDYCRCFWGLHVGNTD